MKLAVTYLFLFLPLALPTLTLLISYIQVRLVSHTVIVVVIFHATHIALYASRPEAPYELRVYAAHFLMNCLLYIYAICTNPDHSLSQKVVFSITSLIASIFLLAISIFIAISITPP